MLVAGGAHSKLRLPPVIGNKFTFTKIISKLYSISTPDRYKWVPNKNPSSVSNVSPITKIQIEEWSFLYRTGTNELCFFKGGGGEFGQIFKV